MIALKLTDIKTLMNQLLCSELFDNFLLAEASIAKDATFHIDGHINASYYSTEEIVETGINGISVLP